MRKSEYYKFLKTRFWKRLSAQARRRDHGKCVHCKQKRYLQVHHRIYRPNWFDTKLEDLETLCHICHGKEHGKLPPRVVFKPGMYEGITIHEPSELELARQRRISNRALLKQRKQQPRSEGKSKVNREPGKSSAQGAVSRGGNAATFSHARHIQRPPLPSSPQFRVQSQLLDPGQAIPACATSKPVTSASPSTHSLGHGPAGASSRSLKASVAQPPSNTVPSIVPMVITPPASDKLVARSP